MRRTHLPRIGDVTEVLRDDPDLLLGYAFGSVADGASSPTSDVDIAVLAAAPLRSEHRRHLIASVAAATGRPVDLIDLRSAGLPLLRVVLTEGRPLFCRDRRAKELLISKMLADVEDFLPLRRRMLQERRQRWIHRSSRRSSSRSGDSDGPETLADDMDRQDILAMNLTRAVQLGVDMAVHVLVDTSRPAPRTMGESFELLAAEGIIDASLAERMRVAVGFRNVAVHSYRSVDWSIVHTITHEGSADFRDFAARMARLLDA